MAEMESSMANMAVRLKEAEARAAAAERKLAMAKDVSLAPVDSAPPLSPPSSVVDVADKITDEQPRRSSRLKACGPHSSRHDTDLGSFMQNEGGDMSGLRIFASAASAANDRIHAEYASIIQGGVRRLIAARREAASAIMIQSIVRRRSALAITVQICHVVRIQQSFRRYISGRVQKLATIGNGVAIQPSLIKEAGRGLFAKGRRFQIGDEITEYAGISLSSKLEASQRMVQTHIVHYSPIKGRGNASLGNDIYIDGDRLPVAGRGGGSFANHKAKKLCNAEFIGRWVGGEPKVFLKATDLIEDGDEIYVHCGSDLEVMMGSMRREPDGKTTKTVPVPWGSLHSRGFQVYEKEMMFSAETKEQMRSSECESIFNGKDGKGRLTSDGRRLQTAGTPELTASVLPRMEASFRSHDLLRCSTGEKSLARLVALRSLKRRSKHKKHQPRSFE